MICKSLYVGGSLLRPAADIFCAKLNYYRLVPSKV